MYNIFVSISRIIYTSWISNEFKYFGKNSKIFSLRSLIGGEYISIGDNTIIGSQAVITAWDTHGEYTFTPFINIGKNISIGNDCHISAINNISIGDNVLMGMKVTITDNSHGTNTIEEVTIGRNSIIGANAVVTGDIPSNSIAVGIPAKVIKTFK